MPTYTQTSGGSRPGSIIQNADTCQLCDAADCPTIFDAALQSNGKRFWGWVCEACFDSRHGVLGVGFGQRYDHHD